MTYCLHFLVAFICVSIGLNTAFSQSKTTVKDTLKEMDKLTSAKRFDSALALCDSFRKNHPKNVEALRRYLQLLYWSGETEQANAGYKVYLENDFPNEQKLQLDYARFLFETGKIRQAKIILDEYVLRDTINLEAKYLLGIIRYWQGEASGSRALLLEVVKKDPGNKKALKYLEEIEAWTSPQVYVQAGYYSDQQPIKKFVTTTEGKLYRSNWLFPFIRFQKQLIQNHNDTWWIEGGNALKLQKTGTGAEVSLGIAKYASSSYYSDWTGSLTLQQSIYKSLQATIGVAKKPYFYTLNSLMTPVTQKEITATLNWGKSYEIYTSSTTSFLKLENWNAKLGTAFMQFEDDNTLHNTYGWFLTPPAKLSLLNFRIGYSYSYNNTGAVRYRSTLSLEGATENVTAQKPIPGIYDPYFTPLNQNIHSIMGSISFAPVKNLFVQVKGNYGFYAYAQAPYIYLDKDHSGTVYFASGTAYQSYTPFEVAVNSGYHLTKNLAVDAGYTYTRNFFFDSQYAKLGVKYLFNQ